MQLARRGQQGTIVVVLVAVQVIVGGIQSAGILQQFNLRQASLFTEHLNGLFGGSLVAVNGMVFSNDGHHALSQLGDVVGGNLYPVSLFVLTVDVHIVSVADGNVNHDAALWPDVVSCLAQHKKQGTGVGTDATGRLQVQKFYRFLLVDTIVHTLYLIVYFCTDWTKIHR